METNDTIKKMLRACHYSSGMLPDEVYIRLFLSIKQIIDGPILEIGTAHGAATTAIGLGVLREHKTHQIYTVDTFGGRFSSRSKFGSPEKNLEIVSSNLKRSGIQDFVSVFKGSSTDFAHSGNCPGSLSMLLLDADGRIDRDFLFFYPLLQPEAIVVIDDADDNIFLSFNQDNEPYVDLKHRITHILAYEFERHGLIKDLEMVANTLFCKSTGASLEPNSFMQMCLCSYRELVFSVGGDQWRDLAAIARQAKRARQAIDLYNGLLHITAPLKQLGRGIGLNRLYRFIRSI